MFGRSRSDKQENLAVERLENSLQALKSDVHDLQAANKRLELEWTETYDKVRHQMSRMARRGDLAKSNGPGDILPPEGTGEPEMDDISASIHARRNRSFIGRG